MKKFALFMLLMPVWGLTFVLGAGLGKNYTPTQIWEKVEWMSKVKIAGSITDPPDAVYFMQSTVPAPGFVHLPGGQILFGNLQIQRRFNKSETDVDIQCVLIRDGKRRVYTMHDLDYFYLAFNAAKLGGKTTRQKRVVTEGIGPHIESEAKSSSTQHEAPGIGEITLTNGAKLTGTFLMDWTMERSDLFTYQLIYFAEKPTDNMTIFTAAVVESAAKKVAGKEIRYQKLFGEIVDRAEWIARLKAGKVDQTVDIVKGTATLDNDETLSGTVGMGKGKIPAFTYFFSDDEQFLGYFDASSVPQALQINIKGGVEYTFGDDGFYSPAEMGKLLERSLKKLGKGLVEGTITLNDGTEQKGKIALQAPPSSFSYMGKREFTPGLFFQDASGQVRRYGKERVKGYTETTSGKTTQYAIVKHSFDNYGTWKTVYTIVNITAKAAEVTSPAVITLKNKEVKGKGKIDGTQLWYFDDAGTLSIVQASEVVRVEIQEPSGREVYFGGSDRFNQLFYPDGAISFYQNPTPTHCNLKASRTANAVNNLITDVMMTGAAMTAASAEENKNKTPEQIVGEAKKATDPLRVDPNFCSVYYEEYFLVINGTNEQILVYDENIRSVVTSLMLGCGDVATVNKRIRKSRKIKDIFEMVKYVNSAGCASKKFDILEPTPLAAYKWRSGFLSMYNYDDKGQVGTKRAMTTWSKGWIQTIGGNKVEGLISIIGEKKIENRKMTKEVTSGNTTMTITSSSIFNRKASFEYDGVELRIIEKRKVLDLVYSFYLDKNVIRSVGRERIPGSIEDQYEEFDSLQVYEPTQELFLAEDVQVFAPNGSFTNGKGETTPGKITLDIPPGLWFAKSATYEDEDGNKLTLTSSEDLKVITAKINGTDHKYIPYRGVFVELLVDGPKFRYFRNPYPTNKREGVAFIANTAATVQAQATGDPSGSTAIKGNEGLADAAKLESFKEEFVYQNSESREEIVLHSGNSKRMLEAYLSLCDKFNAMDKKAKDAILKSDDPRTVIPTLDSCY